MYKIVLLILLTVPASAFSQKYFFVNNDIQKAPFSADTAGIKTLNEGYAGYSRSDLPAIVNYLKEIRQHIQSNDVKTRYLQFKTGNAVFLGEKFHYYYGTRYDINLYALTNDIAGKIIVSNSRFSNKLNLKRIDELLSIFNAEENKPVKQ